MARGVIGIAGVGDWVRARSPWLSAGMAAILLGACSGNLTDLSTSSVAGYEPASLFSPNGYSVSANSDGSLRVTASGSPGTPGARLEKIALARAAEYGQERHAKTFRTSPIQTSISCGKTKISGKEGQSNVRPQDYRTVAMDVSFDPSEGGGDVRPVRDTAQTLTSELKSEVVPPDVQAAAAQEVAQHCSR